MINKQEILSANRYMVSKFKYGQENLHAKKTAQKRKNIDNKDK